MILMTKMIQDIIECNRNIYMAITGGGTRAISKLLENGGASGVFMGANIPYAELDLAVFIDTWVQRNVWKCCSEETAKNMADSALEKCKSMSIIDEHLNVGLGCTAVLSRGKDEREDRINQAFICVTGDHKIIEIYVEFVPTSFIGRPSQEDMLSNLILAGLADFVISTPKYIQGHIDSNPYVRIQMQNRKLGEEV